MEMTFFLCNYILTYIFFLNCCLVEIQQVKVHSKFHVDFHSDQSFHELPSIRLSGTMEVLACQMLNLKYPYQHPIVEGLRLRLCHRLEMMPFYLDLNSKCCNNMVNQH